MYTSIESFATVFATVLTRAFPTRTLSFFAMDREEKKFVRVQTEGCELGYKLPVLLLQDFSLLQLGLQNAGARTVPYQRSFNLELSQSCIIAVLGALEIKAMCQALQQ